MCFYFLKRKSRLEPTMTGERYFSKVAVHPFQPPSFFTTADYADDSDKISSALCFGVLPQL